MNIEKRKYAIYKFNRHYGKPGYWERHAAYMTPDAATQALIDLTRKPKRERIFVYTIGPNEGRERWILVSKHKELLDSAR